MNLRLKQPCYISPLNRSTLAYVYAQDDANDLALLRTDIAGNAVASFRLRPRLGERVATYGFPYLIHPVTRRKLHAR